jgi:amidase
VNAAIARIEAGDGAINAVVVRDFDRARAAADEADRRIMTGERTPLLGLPITVKEAFDVAGLPTTWGFERAKGNIATSDAVAVRRLRNAGAIVLGKTNVAPGLSDWQSDNPVYGRTNNPADHSRTVGGSSGGSAAALAMDYVALELGSDIGGSIRVPAHFCGVWGHKATYQALPTHGHRFPGTDGASEPLGVIGPMARDAADLAAAIDILSEFPLPRPATLTGLRVLLLTDHPSARTESAIRAAVERAGAVLEAQGVAVDTSSDLIPDLARQHQAFARMLAITFARGASSAGGKVASLAEWFDMLDEQARCQRAWSQLFQHYDAVLSPPDVCTAFAHRDDPYSARMITVDGAEARYDTQLVWPGLATYPGLPATCVPVARDAAGLPIGVQVMGDLRQDHRTIAIADLIHKGL